MVPEEFLLLAAGVILLIAGAELLDRGASRLAAIAGISPLVIGLTVVAYGTSSPELAVSLKSAFAGQADIAIANLVGSNIFNVVFFWDFARRFFPCGLASADLAGRTDYDRSVGARIRGCFGRRHWSL